MNQLDNIEKSFLKKTLPPIKAGDTVRIHTRIKEGTRERIQVFQGLVLRLRGSGMGKTVTVRKVSYGVGVERIFPLHSPSIAQIEFVSRGKVRQSRIYYMRQRFGKKARMEQERIVPGLSDAGAKKKQESSASKETPSGE